MALIAAFGMYDRPETAGANERLWALMRAALPNGGTDAPDTLTRGDGAYMAGWLSPNLLISQTCSLPFRAKLANTVQLIATPDYGLAGCPAGHYRSLYIARRSDGFADLADSEGRSFAYNEALSHSGWAAPYGDHFARGIALKPALQTGGHRESAMAVSDGRADFAAIDALTWEMIKSYDSFAGNLQVFDHTPPSPSLPFITAQDPAPLRTALALAISALSAADRDTLHLRGLVAIPKTAYLAMPIPPAPAHK
jgi:ABC-type phosphate/phosphonate transport system substrate-binding protein